MPDCIGIFGGMFDPIHRAHIQIAQTAGNQLKIPRILWVVAGDPSHKAQVASAKDRLEMVRLTLQSLADSRMRLDDREIVNAEFGLESFTSDTIASLQHESPAAKLILILGEDQIHNFQSWRRWKWLIRFVEFAVCERPTIEAQEMMNTIRKLGGIVHILEIKPNITSSTQIRKEIKDGSLNTDLISKDVADYISARQLYR